MNETGNEWGLGQAGISLNMVKNASGGHELLLGAPGVRMWSGMGSHLIRSKAFSFIVRLKMRCCLIFRRCRPLLG
jgi:hypothetical protein